jgi:exosortase/archaeosortase family protein
MFVAQAVETVTSAVNPLGRVHRVGTVFYTDEWCGHITRACTGHDALVITYAFMVGAPVAARRKLRGLLSATIAVLVINAVRVCTIVIAAGWSTDAAIVLHDIVLPTVYVPTWVGLGIAWYQRASAVKQRGD